MSDPKDPVESFKELIEEEWLKEDEDTYELDPDHDLTWGNSEDNGLNDYD